MNKGQGEQTLPHRLTQLSKYSLEAHSMTTSSIHNNIPSFNLRNQHFTLYFDVFINVKGIKK